MKSNKTFIEWNAVTGDRESDIKSVIESIDSDNTIIVIKNAHLLTTAAFNCLQQFIEENPTVNLILVSDEPDKIFPPLIDCVYEKNESAERKRREKLLDELTSLNVEVGAYSEDPLDELVRQGQEWGMYE
jgi:hypothetical protein